MKGALAIAAVLLIRTPVKCQVTAEENTDQYTGIFGANVVHTIDAAKG